MILKTFNDTVEHRGKTLVIRAVRNGRGARHLVTVASGSTRREFEIGGRFSASLRIRAVEKFSGMERE